MINNHHDLFGALLLKSVWFSLLLVAITSVSRITTRLQFVLAITSTQGNVVIILSCSDWCYEERNRENGPGRGYYGCYPRDCSLSLMMSDIGTLLFQILYTTTAQY